MMINKEDPIKTFINGVTKLDWFKFFQLTKKLDKNDPLIDNELSEGSHTHKIILDNYDKFVKEYTDTVVTESEFKSYLRIQHLGYYNMYDPRARQFTGLSEAKYSSIIRNYNTYMEIYKETYKEIFRD